MSREGDHGRDYGLHVMTISYTFVAVIYIGRIWWTGRQAALLSNL
jgi:hypothetical protein